MPAQSLWSQCVFVCELGGCSLTPASNMASFSPLEAGPKVVSDSERDDRKIDAAAELPKDWSSGG